MTIPWCWTLTRRRLPPDHMLFEEGDLYCYIKVKQLQLDDSPIVIRSETVHCGTAGCSAIFDSLIKYEAHYNTCHRNVCSTCHRIFPSPYLLEIHILESHDTMFELLAAKQDMFQCLLQDCSDKFKTSKARRNHMIRVHKYPANFRFDKNIKAEKRDEKKDKSSVSMEIETSGTNHPNKQPLQQQEVQNISHNALENSSQNAPINTSQNATGRKFVSKVPKNICFGQGVGRGFQSGNRRGRGKKKHWHNKDSENSNTKVDIESVDMTDLASALS